MEINRNPRVEYKAKMCRYNLCLSQAIEARHANDFSKAVELYGKALTYNENADVRREFEELGKIKQSQDIKQSKDMIQSQDIIQLQTIVQEWLEPASDFE
jgi:hypothetical protein